MFQIPSLPLPLFQRTLRYVIKFSVNLTNFVAVYLISFLFTYLTVMLLLLISYTYYLNSITYNWVFEVLSQSKKKFGRVLDLQIKINRTMLLICD